MERPSLVEAARAQSCQVPVEFGQNRVVVVGVTGAHGDVAKRLQPPNATDLLDLDPSDHHARARLNIKRHGRAIRVVHDLEPGYNLRRDIAAVAIELGYRLGHALCAARRRRGAKPIGHNLPNLTVG